MDKWRPVNEKADQKRAFIVWFHFGERNNIYAVCC